MPTEEIRVLSVQQPYADEIIYGDKWNELRSRATPYRGLVYIHASRWDGPSSQGSPGPGLTGAIIGRVHLVDCVPGEFLSQVSEHLLHKQRLSAWLQPLVDYLRALPTESWRHGIGDWNWIFVEPAPLQHPVKTRGKLNLWRGSIPAEQLVCAPVAIRVARPAARDYPDFTPTEVDYRPVEEPVGRISGPLFRQLRRSRAKGQHLTPQRLKRLAEKLNTTAPNILSTLSGHEEFERVPGAPRGEEWWRVRQYPIEVRRRRYPKQSSRRT